MTTWYGRHRRLKRSRGNSVGLVVVRDGLGDVVGRFTTKTKTKTEEN